MKFDEHGHVVWTPNELYELAKANPLRLVNAYLMTGTPWAFPEYPRYYEFLEALAERTGVHPRNLYLRGTRQRYEYDLRRLIEAVESGRLPRPGDEPVPVKARSVPTTARNIGTRTEADTERKSSNNA